MYNRDASSRLLHQQPAADDVITGRWARRLLRRLEHRRTIPRVPNTYGPLVFSDSLCRNQMRYILDSDIPSFHGCAVLPNGWPSTCTSCTKPPAPQSQDQRQARCRAAGGGQNQRAQRLPFVAGDLNDVAVAHVRAVPAHFSASWIHWPGYCCRSID
jgi:hypothetical protein